MYRYKSNCTGNLIIYVGHAIFGNAITSSKSVQFLSTEISGNLSWFTTRGRGKGGIYQ